MQAVGLYINTYLQVTLAAEAAVLSLFRKDLKGRREGGAVLNTEISLPVSESSRSQKKPS